MYVALGPGRRLYRRVGAFALKGGGMAAKTLKATLDENARELESLKTLLVRMDEIPPDVACAVLDLGEITARRIERSHDLVRRTLRA